MGSWKKCKRERYFQKKKKGKTIDVRESAKDYYPLIGYGKVEKEASGRLTTSLN